jgi:ABC-2 type transport system permease protein
MNKSAVLSNLTLLLVQREWRRVFMEPTRLVGMMLQPLLFLAVFGLGFANSFSLADGRDLSYAAYFFPGILGLVVLFSSIYATLTLVEDKKCGFFRLVLVSPGGVAGAIVGKVVATMSLGLVQSLLFLLLVLVLPLQIGLSHLACICTFLLLGSLCFAIIGVCFAWLSPSSSAFHALMSVILIPMWLISGAMFPLDSKFLAALAYANPMAYLVSGLRAEFVGEHSHQAMAILVLFCVTCFAGLIYTVNRRAVS